jgi:hypothetical protein
MKSNDTAYINVQLKGLRPLMFDRYAGDNQTKLPTQEKMYLTKTGEIYIPALNVFSLLAAKNTDSVARQFFGKNGKNIALGINSFTSIREMEILVCDDNGPIKFVGWNEQVYVHTAVARLAKGVPNPKERPTISLPWSISFTVEYIENSYCTFANLRQAYRDGGTLGLGTFRPQFGRYEMVKFAEQ